MLDPINFVVSVIRRRLYICITRYLYLYIKLYDCKYANVVILDNCVLRNHRPYG